MGQVVLRDNTAAWNVRLGLVRRFVAILVLVFLLPSATGLAYAIHLHCWHNKCGDDSHHDNHSCPVFRAMVTASQTEVDSGPAFVAEAELWGPDAGPAQHTPRLIRPAQPIEPRAPPAFAL